MSTDTSLPRKSVVVGYDGSPTSVAALSWALEAAGLRGAGVRVVYAVPPTPEIVAQFGGSIAPDFAMAGEAGAQVLAAAVAEAHRVAPDIAVDTRVVYASASAALLTDTHEDEMLVVGSRGLGGFAELLVGSTGVQLASHARCPVVVIRPQASGRQPEPGSGAGRIVVGVDGSPVSDEAVHFAFQEASLRGVGVTALHAWEKAPYDRPPAGSDLPAYVVADELAGTEARLLADVLGTSTSRYPDVDLRQEAVNGDPVDALVTSSVGAVMVVVGSRGHGGFSSLLLGSVSHGVLHHARCPVVIVRRPAP
jgi:nucleotide-binding universal stress UspA family protein